MARKTKNSVVLKSIERSTDLLSEGARKLRATRTIHVHLIDKQAWPLDRIEKMFRQQDHAGLEAKLAYRAVGIELRLVGTDERTARQIEKDQTRFRAPIVLINLPKPLMQIGTADAGIGRFRSQKLILISRLLRVGESRRHGDGAVGPIDYDASHALIGADVVVIPEIGIFARELGQGDTVGGMEQKVLKIALVDQPFQDDAAHGRPFELRVVLVRLCKIRDIGVFQAPDQIIKIGGADGIILLYLGIFEIVHRNYNRGIAVGVRVDAAQHVIPVAWSGTTEGDRGKLVTGLHIIGIAGKKAHARIADGEDLAGIGAVAPQLIANIEIGRAHV